MTTDTKRDGVAPVPQTVSHDGRETVSSLGSGNPFALLCIASKRTSDADYSTDWRDAPQQAWSPVPVYWKGVLVEWITPEAAHTDEMPFCAVMACQCHHDAVRMERYFIRPIEQGVLSIAEAIDLYHAEPGYMARKQAEARAREAVGV